MTEPKPAVRCAIYTRKSTEEGLDQAFNSLQAQREACEAYVKSQRSEGWRVLPETYDDGGFSGGTLERPALRRLLDDIDAGRIDTIVVYKIDRLTRSLADFAKIVERLEKRGASFVSVTQAFNTTTSMGRLTLNVLLSFAQFEREVTGERIRDKIAASKAKGMWMGGMPPLGYDRPTDLQTRALVVNEGEAELVRLIFDRYLQLRSVPALQAWLNEEGLRSKAWTTSAGKRRGGLAFARGALFHLLRNRIYLGEIIHGEKTAVGAHPAIVDLSVFEKAQALLDSNKVVRSERPLRSADLPLKGLLFDIDGHVMSPSFGYGRGGKVYRYYVSAPLQQGQHLEPDGRAIRRIKAETIEGLVREQLSPLIGRRPDAALTILLEPVRRIALAADELKIEVRRDALSRSGAALLEGPDADAFGRLTVPIKCQTRGGRASLILPHGAPYRSNERRDPVLIAALRKAHRIAAGIGWKAADGSLRSPDVEAPKNAYDRKLCRLAFLAPTIQRSILEGRQPANLTLDRLLQPFPVCWREQRRLLGYSENNP